MNVENALKQLNELIRQDYRVPRLAPISFTDDPPTFVPDHISIKDCVMPLIRDYEIAKKREAYCIDVILYLVGRGCLFPYQDNLKKQEFMNDLHNALPEVRFPVYYPDKCNYNTPPTEQEERV